MLEPSQQALMEMTKVISNVVRGSAGTCARTLRVLFYTLCPVEDPDDLKLYSQDPPVSESGLFFYVRSLEATKFPF